MPHERRNKVLSVYASCAEHDQYVYCKIPRHLHRQHFKDRAWRGVLIFRRLNRKEEGLGPIGEQNHEIREVTPEEMSSSGLDPVFSCEARGKSGESH